MKTAIVLSIFVVGLLAPALSQTSNLALETSDLIVSSTTTNLSNEQLKQLANDAQKTMDKILTFWSADARIERFGKVSVVFAAQRRDVESSVFYWEKQGDRRVRIVAVFGTDGVPQMMAHKLTSAVFPQKDKLIRNMMGILTEVQVGNPSAFPMCGFNSDEWVLALLETRLYIPLEKLGPDHESWGMKDRGGGRLMITDEPKQHTAYSEAGSFGNYLFETYGIVKIKQLQRLSQVKDRPWQEVFGTGMQELEANWLKTLRANAKAREGNVSILLKLVETSPARACSAAQNLVIRKQ